MRAVQTLMQLSRVKCSFEHPADVSLSWADMNLEALTRNDRPPPAPPNMGLFLTVFVEQCPEEHVHEAKSFISKGNHIFRRKKQLDGQLPRGPKHMLNSKWGYKVEQTVGPFVSHAHDFRKMWRKRSRNVVSRRQFGVELAIATRTRLFTDLPIDGGLGGVGVPPPPSLAQLRRPHKTIDKRAKRKALEH